MDIAKKDGEKIKVLILIDYYLPGSRGGGPIRSIANLVEALGNEFEFHIVTTDRDLNAEAPYVGIPSDRWMQVGKARVIYLSRTGKSLVNLWKLMRETNHDVLYLNSFFSRRLSIFPCLFHWLGLVPKVKVVLAPRGQFSICALDHHKWRKRIYLSITRIMGLYRRLTWHASSKYELADIERTIMDARNIKKAIPIKSSDYRSSSTEYGVRANMNIAPDIAKPSLEHTYSRTPKEPGRLNMVFLSRINKIKNIDGALMLLDGIAGKIGFDIYGPLEDEIYWKKCRQLMEGLPGNVTVRYCGEVETERVSSVFRKYELFLFLTHGENYGHVIPESLSAGCPVLISDRTPWRGLEEEGAGWDVALEDVARVKAILQRCVDMGDEEFQRLSGTSCNYARQKLNDPSVIDNNRRLFGSSSDT